MIITEKSKNFIEKYVLSNLGYTNINDDNISEIVDYITDNFEVASIAGKRGRRYH